MSKMHAIRPAKGHLHIHVFTSSMVYNYQAGTFSFGDVGLKPHNHSPNSSNTQ